MIERRAGSDDEFESTSDDIPVPDAVPARFHTPEPSNAPNAASVFTSPTPNSGTFSSGAFAPASRYGFNTPMSLRYAIQESRTPPVMYRPSGPRPWRRVAAPDFVALGRGGKHSPAPATDYNMAMTGGEEEDNDDLEDSTVFNTGRGEKRRASPPRTPARQSSSSGDIGMMMAAAVSNANDPSTALFMHSLHTPNKRKKMKKLAKSLSDGVDGLEDEDEESGEQ